MHKLLGLVLHIVYMAVLNVAPRLGYTGLSLLAIYLPPFALFFLGYKVVCELKNVFGHGQMSTFESTLRGKEKLSRVFWWYGVIYFAAFSVACELVFWIGDAARGRSHFSETSRDASTETIIYQCLLSGYALWWFIGIVMCLNNTRRAAWRRPVLVLACILMAMDLSWWLDVYAPRPSQAQALLKCTTELEDRRREIRAWIASETAKHNVEHPESVAGAAMSAEDDQRYLARCAEQARQIGWH